MARKVVVYETSEVTLDRDLHFYSGGLGEVAGGIARAAHELNLPVVGLSLLYREGYGEQGVGEQGMTYYYKRRSYDHVLVKTGKRCRIMINGFPVYADIWECPRGTFSSMPFYFLDTDIDANNYLGRLNTRFLYGGSSLTGRTMETMISQSIVLGVGAVEAMRELGLEVSLFHLNESHAVMTPLYLLYLELMAGLVGLEDPPREGVEEAINSVRKRVVFTNHTPIDAGNPKYDVNSILTLSGFHSVISHELMHRLGGGALFDATLVCLRLAKAVNAVSERHLQICKGRWGDLPETAPWSGVTNGVTPWFWQSPEWRDAASPRAIQELKAEYKFRMFYYILGRTDENLENDRLTIGWFRRFVEYKRPKLIFRDLEWIRGHLERGDFHLIMGGKPHPDDKEFMVPAWNEIYRMACELPNLVLLHNYDPLMSRIVKAGCDLWFSSPRVPYEACSTSGMSAAMLGANLMSTKDGWLWELDPAERNVFLFGTSVPSAMYEQDAYDVAELKRVLDEEVIPEYYDRKSEWYARAARIKKIAEERYNHLRMMRQYWKFYGCEDMV